MRSTLPGTPSGWPGSSPRRGGRWPWSIFRRAPPACRGSSVWRADEGRFVYEERGFHCLADLGEWWEAQTGLPIPLGCIAARKNLGAERIADIEERLRRSIQTAWEDPASTASYVKEHAQELDDDVIRRHIETYVNDFTLDLSEEGRAAIEELRKMAKAAGVIG